MTALILVLLGCFTLVLYVPAAWMLRREPFSRIAFGEFAKRHWGPAMRRLFSEPVVLWTWTDRPEPRDPCRECGRHRDFDACPFARCEERRQAEIANPHLLAERLRNTPHVNHSCKRFSGPVYIGRKCPSCGWEYPK